MEVLLLTLTIALFGFGQAQAQKLLPNIIQQDTTAYLVVDELPVLIANGEKYKTKDIQNYINKHLYKWPDPQMDCAGIILISIIVEVDDSVNDRKYLKKLCPEFDEEAMRIVSLMNKWEAGVLNGEKVRTKLALPVKFDTK